MKTDILVVLVDLVRDGKLQNFLISPSSEGFLYVSLMFGGIKMISDNYGCYEELWELLEEEFGASYMNSLCQLRSQVQRRIQ